MPTKKISVNDLWVAMGHAQQFLTQMPAGAYLPGMTRSLTDGERLALSYMASAFMVAGSHGVDTHDLVIELRTPDSEALE